MKTMDGHDGFVSAYPGSNIFLEEGIEKNKKKTIILKAV